MKYQVTGGHSSVKTWHGWEGFPGQCQRAFTTVGEKNLTRRSTQVRIFLAKTAQNILMTQNKGWNPFVKVINTSDLLFYLSVETIWTLAWLNGDH